MFGRTTSLETPYERLRSHGVTVLRNESITSNAIGFVGIDDAEDKQQVGKQLAGIERAKDTFSVLLYHRPDDFESAAGHGFDLMLAGHTHNGQIAPFNYLVKNGSRRSLVFMNRETRGYMCLQGQELGATVTPRVRQRDCGF